MIPLTKLDQTKVLLCFDNVKYIESVPDTLIFFTNGEMLIVRESLDEVRELFIKYKSAIAN